MPQEPPELGHHELIRLKFDFETPIRLIRVWGHLGTPIWLIIAWYADLAEQVWNPVDYGLLGVPIRNAPIDRDLFLEAYGQLCCLERRIC